MSLLNFKRMTGARTMTRAEMVETTRTEVKAIMESILADPLGPTKVLADGKITWINRFLDAMHGYQGVDREMAEYQWALYRQEHARRFPGESPAQVMDDTHVRSETTAQEVRDSLTHHVDSSREARVEHYGPDDYDVDNAAAQARDSFTDEELRPARETLEDLVKALPEALDGTEVRH